MTFIESMVLALTSRSLYFESDDAQCERVATEALRVALKVQAVMDSRALSSGLNCLCGKAWHEGRCAMFGDIAPEDLTGVNSVVRGSK